MKPVRNVTAVMVLAALAAVGCSKGNEVAEAKDGVPGAVAKPAFKPEPLAAKGTAGDLVPAATVATPASFDAGEVAYNARKYGEAAAIFEGYTERRPANAWGHYMLGL